MTTVIQKHKDSLISLDKLHSCNLNSETQHALQGLDGEEVYLWKVRTTSRWARKKFDINVIDMNINYSPTGNCCAGNGTYTIAIADIQEVRRGWKSKKFRKIEKQQSKPSNKPEIEEGMCFSIIHGARRNKTLDLVAQSVATAEKWADAIEKIVSWYQMKQLDAGYELWLRQKFNSADVNHDKRLTLKEIKHLLHDLNIEVTKEEAFKLFTSAMPNSGQTEKTKLAVEALTEDEFLVLYFKLIERQEVLEIFKSYISPYGEFTATQLQKFLQTEQGKGYESISGEECSKLLQKHEQSDSKLKGRMTLAGFQNLLMSPEFDIFDYQTHGTVYQDMSYPLSHYYIASSHNTYIVGNQLSGKSSVEAYIDSLKRGCKCVEIDLWDGEDGEPIIWHGHTLVTKIPFRVVLEHAIKPFAFVVSNFPLILSLEIHCSSSVRAKISSYLKEILGNVLYTVESMKSTQSLPSPVELQGKVLVKAKSVFKDKNARKSSTAPDSSPLPILLQARKFTTFEDSGECYEMSSFSEAKAMKYLKERPVEFVNYNKKHLSRIYPAATRTTSSNFMPTTFWRLGCQIVALNYQTRDTPNMINDAMFRQNGGCGYVLKPEFLRAASFESATHLFKNACVLRICIISGQHLPKAENESEVVDPYVEFYVIGGGNEDESREKFTTRRIQNNGFNPIWNETFEMAIDCPELAFLFFRVRDYAQSGSDVALAYYAAPFTAITTGYRHIRLENIDGEIITPASLFVHIEIKRD